MRRRQVLAALCPPLWMLPSCPVGAASAENDVKRLDGDLTPMGALRAGNREGSIPSWDGGLSAPPLGLEAAQGHYDPLAGCLL
jgi:hypothetical protein